MQVVMCWVCHKNKPVSHRVSGMWKLLDDLVSWIFAQKQSSGENVGFQVINLGAGFDTLYWRLKDHLEQGLFFNRECANHYSFMATLTGQLALRWVGL